MKKFTQLTFPLDGEFSSDDGPLPIEFFLTVFPSSAEAYLKLGYFSSSAIQVLACGFAQFIANGGSISIVTNHFLYSNDVELVSPKKGQNLDLNDVALLRDPEWVYDRLNIGSQHFLDCLKFLSNAGRLKLVPVMLSPARMVHFKEGVFVDKVGNKVSFTGSCNFTGAGLVENGESLSVTRSWMSEADEAKCQKRLRSIVSIVNESNELYTYLSPREVLDAALTLGREKPLSELLEQEQQLLRSSGFGMKSVASKYQAVLEEAISEYKSKPRFPFSAGPRVYQQEAYECWLANGCRGIFAMATGTGKTITSLNCLLNVFNETGFYQAVIVVPTRPLVAQWLEEVSLFNFSNVIAAHSENYRWLDEVGMLDTTLLFNPRASFVLITTYDTIISNKLISRIETFPSTTMLIADEAHNFGREAIKNNSHRFPFELRIALSATPRRRFDDDGNQFIEDFFNDSDPYTYSFSMEKAIREGVLCQYDYFPHTVELSQEEMERYTEISAKLSKLFDSDSGAFYNPEYAKILLLERRRVIHKAVNKLGTFREVIANLERSDKLSYSFVYAPEGDDPDGERLLRSYMSIFEQEAPSRRAHHYTSETENREEVMTQFENQNIDVLFSMKCLDEGIDVPRAEVAVFCSSTGNPRQFIQRRGRVLRKHKAKEKAIIHDLVVIPPVISDPNVNNKLETQLVKEELIRVVYFASLARNYNDVMKLLQPVASKYGINLFAMQQELMEQ